VIVGLRSAEMLAAMPDRLRLLAIVAVLLAGCGGGGGDGGDPSPAPAPSPSLAGDPTCGFASFQTDTLQLINQRRAAGASCGSEGTFGPAPPLAWNDRLAAAALSHAGDMAENDYFAHESRDGTTPAQRVSAAGYDWSTAGENIAAGQGSVPEVVNGWMNSPGHCANIMNSQFVHFGMACAADPDSTYRHYWVLELAAPR
jgi:uncharacterized protein YkwD